jgi:hypothetical protein
MLHVMVGELGIEFHELAPTPLDDFRHHVASDPEQILHGIINELTVGHSCESQKHLLDGVPCILFAV